MSADLLAEFDSFYQSPTSTQPQQNLNQRQNQNASKPVAATASADPFDFSHFGAGNNSSGNVPVPASRQAQPWDSFSTQTQPSGSQVWGDFSSLSGVTSEAPAQADDDEGWGDFEVAESVPKAAAVAPTPAPAVGSSTSSLPARTRIMRAPTIDLMTNNLIDVGGISRPNHRPSWAQPASVVPAKPKPPPDPNVLFDAEALSDSGNEGEDDDEFGDFETVSPAPQSRGTQLPPSRPQPASFDLLSLDDPPTTAPAQKKPAPPGLTALNLQAPTSPYPQAPKSPSFQERNPFPGLGLTTPTSSEPAKKEGPKSASPVTAWPSFGTAVPEAEGKIGEDDGWAAFEDFPPETKPATTDSTKPPLGWDWDAADAATSTPAEPESKDSSPPPINVPPPSVLLSIFPQLLNMGNSVLFKPLGAHTAIIKKRILADPGTVVFLKAYLLLATVAARIIAGRKLRWHRDKFLSQGMAISAAGAKGMKLAGVDKAQASREDREAGDVIDVWKEQIGRLRSAVAAANSALPKGSGPQLKVPELSETMPVQTARVVPTAPKPCVICGLKRDERVTKVDYDVEDSFGEWWAEHWGHRACKNFWTEHEKQLRQR